MQHAEINETGIKATEAGYLSSIRSEAKIINQLSEGNFSRKPKGVGRKRGAAVWCCLFQTAENTFQLVCCGFHSELFSFEPLLSFPDISPTTTKNEL